jgi:hypothetical protein
MTTKQPKAEPTFKVRAIKRGFFGGVYRTPKDSLPFSVTKSQFSDAWMEKVSSKNKKVIEPREDGYVPLEIPTLMKKYADQEAAETN